MYHYCRVAMPLISDQQIMHGKIYIYIVQYFFVDSNLFPLITIPPTHLLELMQGKLQQVVEILSLEMQQVFPTHQEKIILSLGRMPVFRPKPEIAILFLE